MPAEWEPHSATWLAWPHNLETWPAAGVLPAVERTYLSIIRVLAPDETVCILVNDRESLESVREKIADAKIPLDRMQFHIIPTDDAWIRDYGPNFLVNGDRPAGQEKEDRKKNSFRSAGVKIREESPDQKQERPRGESALRAGIACNNWGFDSWGGKYDWKLDNEAAGKIARTLNSRTFDPGIALEGGAIDVNGQGICLTTEPCLLNPNRNSGLSREVMESYLKNFLGVQKIIWLKGGIEGDDTDGHIDNLARFVNPATILCAHEEDARDPNFRGLDENYEILRSAADLNGNPMNIVRLPMPGKVETTAGRLPASYANFYIGNRSVLSPVYGVPNDQKALAVLREAFPDREVAPVPCRELARGLGAIHCITQQQPR